MGKYLIASTRKLQWEQQMWENEVEMRKELLQRNEETLHFLEQEKLKLVAEENFAEASLVKEEIAALRTEAHTRGVFCVFLRVRAQRRPSSPLFVWGL